MSSTKQNGSIAGGGFKTTVSTVLMTGALALAALTAQAQVVSAPHGNLAAGANRISLSPSAPYAANPYNTNTQNYSMFGGASGSSYGVLGFNNIYGISVSNGIGNAGGFAGLGGLDPYSSYFGMPLGGLAGGLAANNISLVGGGTFGFSTIGPNGTYFTGPNGPYNPYQNPRGGDYLPSASQSGQASRDPSIPKATTATPDRTSPEALARSIVVRRGRDYGISVAWRGDPKLLSSMKVTLLNQYHLPLAQQDAVADVPANFAAGPNAYAARYYRVDVQYADGAVATLTGPLTR